MIKGTMIQFKKILGYLIGIMAFGLIFLKEKTLELIFNGFTISGFEISILSILLIINAYFLIIAGRRK